MNGGDMMSKTGKVIRTRREELGYTQKKTAEMTGVSNTEISKIENGERENPNPIILKKIAKALNIDYMQLLVESQYIDPNFLEKDFINISNLNEEDRETIRKLTEEAAFNKNFYPSEYERISKIIITHTVKEILKLLEEEPEINFGYRFMNATFDAIIFTNNNDIICIDFQFISSVSFMHGLMHRIERSKAKFLDFYFSFRKSSTDEKLKFINIFYISTEINEDLLKKKIDFIDKKTIHLKPIYQYKIITNNEVLSQV